MTKYGQKPDNEDLEKAIDTLNDSIAYLETHEAQAKSEIRILNEAVECLLAMKET